jgi:hypothetical protein
VTPGGARFRFHEAGVVWVETEEPDLRCADATRDDGQLREGRRLRAGKELLPQAPGTRKVGRIVYTAEFWFYAAARVGRGVFRRELDVPFVPAPGLRVRFPEDADYDEGWQVQEAAWQAGEGRFVCRLEGDVDEESEWESFKDHYLARGWSLEEEGFGEDDADGPDDDLPGWLRGCRGEG